MPKKNSEVPLNERVCKRGHVGQYVARPEMSSYCNECELQRRSVIQQAVRELTPPKPKVPLEERVCKRGHVGQYRNRTGSTPACFECLKIAFAQYKERGGVPVVRPPLEERVCKRGHVGQYQTNLRGSVFCTECSKAAQESYKERARSVTVFRGVKLAKLTQRREKLVAQLAELTIQMALEESIKQQLERE
jgi:hypothetical protein